MSNPFSSGGAETPTIMQRVASLNPTTGGGIGATTLASSSKPGPVSPTPPTVTPPAVLPSTDSKAVTDAGRSAVQAINARSGRTSTVLTKRPSTILTNNKPSTNANPLSDAIYSRKSLG